MKKNTFGLIMAGGRGTRFWPLSTDEKPKQFLSITGEKSLICQTFDRLAKFIKKDNIFVVAHRKYLDLTMESIPGFKEENFIDEPVGKNTAPCLILSNIVLSNIDPDADLLVVPADHFIPDEDNFKVQMEDALAFCDNPCMVTAGVRPLMPHTGYGYINFNKENLQKAGDTEFYKVEEFKEKPDLKTAQDYIKQGVYFWNSGMFLYKLRFFKDFINKYSPYFSEVYGDLEKHFDDKDKFSEIFHNIKGDSIDYALLEKMDEVRMFKADFIWNDVGAWTSVYDLHSKDEQNNAAAGNAVLIDTKNSIVFSSEKDKPVALIGLDNIAVVNSENGILVSDMDQLQKVKEVVDKV